MNTLSLDQRRPFESPNGPRRITDQVAFSPNTGTVIDFMCSDERTEFSRQTFAEVTARYPDAILLHWREAERRVEDRHRTKPVEITRVAWWAALECLPPVDWHNRGETETFKCAERITGAITRVFCRIGERYFSFADDIRLPHDEIVARCKVLP